MKHLNALKEMDAETAEGFVNSALRLYAVFRSGGYVALLQEAKLLGAVDFPGADKMHDNERALAEKYLAWHDRLVVANNLEMAGMPGYQEGEEIDQLSQQAWDRELKELEQ